MRRAQAGDRSAFGCLYDRRRTTIERFLIRLTGDPTLADDLTQETFVRAWSARHQWRPHRPPLPWLYGIARNASRNARTRGPARRERSLDDAQEQGAPGPEERIERDHLQAGVRAALDALSEAQRACVLLTVYEGCTFREAADALGCTELAARALAFRARGALRRSLEPWLREESEE